MPDVPGAIANVTSAPVDLPLAPETDYQHSLYRKQMARLQQVGQRRAADRPPQGEASRESAGRNTTPRGCNQSRASPHRPGQTARVRFATEGAEESDQGVKEDPEQIRLSMSTMSGEEIARVQSDDRREYVRRMQSPRPKDTYTTCIYPGDGHPPRSKTGADTGPSLPVPEIINKHTFTSDLLSHAIDDCQFKGKVIYTNLFINDRSGPHRIVEPNAKLSFLAVSVGGVKGVGIDTVMQVDDGSSINIVREDVYRASGAKRTRCHTAYKVNGIGGARHCDTECQLFTTMLGTRMGDWMEKLKVNISARFVIMKNCPVPILMGSNTMSDCGIHNWPAAKMSSIGKEGKIPHLPWSEVKSKFTVKFRRSDRDNGTFDVPSPEAPAGFYDPNPHHELVDTDSDVSVEVMKKPRDSTQAFSASAWRGEEDSRDPEYDDLVDLIQDSDTDEDEEPKGSSSRSRMEALVDKENERLLRLEEEEDEVLRVAAESASVRQQWQQWEARQKRSPQSIANELLLTVEQVSEAEHAALMPTGCEPRRRPAYDAFISSSILITAAIRARESISLLSASTAILNENDESVVTTPAPAPLTPIPTSDIPVVPAMPNPLSNLPPPLCDATLVPSRDPIQTLEPATSAKKKRKKKKSPPGKTADTDVPATPLHPLPAPTYEPDKIILEWASIPNDDASGLAEEYSLSEDATHKPELFPAEHWKYVADEDRPNVPARWSRFPDERLREILTLLSAKDAYEIYTGRPNTNPYCVALLYAHIDGIFHVDESHPPHVSDYEMHIITTSDVPQATQRQQVYSPCAQNYLDVKCPMMCEQGIIELSESGYRAPLVLVQYVERVRAFMTRFGDDAVRAMKDPQYKLLVAAFYRLTVDLRLLNSVTVPDAQPMPRIEDILNSFVGNEFFSCFDVKDAFWTVLLAVADRHKTAFATHNMLYQWCRCPQGSRCGANVWSRIIQSCLKDRPHTVDPYQDDIFAHGRGISEMLSGIRYMFKSLSARNLTVKLSKIKLNFPRMKALGHIITKLGRCPDPDHVEAIVEIGVPTCQKDVLHILGMVTFNRDYIPNLSSVAACLHDVAKDGVDLRREWKDEVHGVAFREIKRLLVSAPFLQLPDATKPFRIHVDSSLNGRGMGAVLLQQDVTWTPPEGKTMADAPWRPVAYWSKKLSDADRARFSATVVEAHGLHDAILHWAPFLDNCLPFSVVVDHQALVYLVTSPTATANRRLLQMVNNLSSFNFSVIYKSGLKHLDADAISRLFRYEDQVISAEPNLHYSTVKESDIRSLARRMSLDADFIDPSRETSRQKATELGILLLDLKAPVEEVAADLVHVMSVMKDEVDEKPDPPTGRLFDARDMEREDLVLGPPMYSTTCCSSDSLTDKPTHWYSENLLTGENSLVMLGPANSVPKRSSRAPKPTTGKDGVVHASTNPEVQAQRAREEAAAATKRTAQAQVAHEQRVTRRARAAEAKAKIQAEERAAAAAVAEEKAQVKKYHARQKILEHMSPEVQQRVDLLIGPAVVPMSLRPDHPETTEEEDQRAKGEDRARSFESLVGKQFMLPASNNLYEVYHVFWDVDSRKVAAYRRSCEGVHDCRDRLAFAVEGRYGISALVSAYEQFAGMDNAHRRWPRSEEEMLAAQHHDPELLKLIEAFDKHETDPNPKPKLDVKLMSKQTYRPIADSGAQGALRARVQVENPGDAWAAQDLIILPELLRTMCLRFYHEGLGHPGKLRLARTIQTRYWWPNVIIDVAKYCARCQHCCRRKADNRVAAMPLQHYPRATRPFELVHIDLIGRLHKTANGYEYILVCKCALTQWIEVIPLQTKTAREVAMALVENIYFRHGSIGRIVSDKGSEFVNSVHQAVHTLLAQRQSSTTPYNPQANGMVENQNRTLKDMLSAYAHDNQRDWDLYLGVIAHAYRTTVNAATGYSPFRALYGREARQVTEDWIQDFSKLNFVDIDEYAQQLALALHYTWTNIADKVASRHLAIDRKFHRPDFERDGDANRVKSRELAFREYVPGDKFYHKMTPKRFYNEGPDGEAVRISAKLQHRYAGPFTVLEVLNPVTYRANINGRTKVVHANKMKRDQAEPIEPRDHVVPDYFEDDLEPQGDGAHEAAEALDILRNQGAQEAQANEEKVDPEEGEYSFNDGIIGAEWFQDWVAEEQAQHESETLEELQDGLMPTIVPLKSLPKPTSRIPIRSSAPSHRRLTNPELKASLDTLFSKYPDDLGVERTRTMKASLIPKKT